MIITGYGYYESEGLGASATWADKTTPDGRWAYGFGQYEKPLTQLLKLQGMTRWLAEQAIVRLNLSSTSQTPVHYIWARGPDGVTRMAGEWTILHGGAAGRDMYFRVWESKFRQAQNDRARVALVEEAQKAPGTASIGQAEAAYREWLRAEVTAEASAKAAEAAHAAAGEQTGKIMGAVVAVAAAGVLAYFALRR